jgi:hypothetical protein
MAGKRSTRILDTPHGCPAAGVRVKFLQESKFTLSKPGNLIEPKPDRGIGTIPSFNNVSAIKISYGAITAH